MMRAYPLVIPTEPNLIGSAIAADFPTWSRAYKDLRSNTRKFAHAVGQPLSLFDQHLFAWLIYYTPYGAEATIRQMLDGTSDIRAWPVELMKQNRFVLLPDKRVISVASASGDNILVFPEIAFAVDYLSSGYSDNTDICFIYPQFDEDGNEREDLPSFLFLTGDHETVNIKYYDPRSRSEREVLLSTARGHLWNQLDEWGERFSLRRIPGEHDWYYARRLMDIYRRPGGANYQGLINGISRDFGLMTHPAQFVLPAKDIGTDINRLYERDRIDESYEAPPRILEFSKYEEKLSFPAEIYTAIRSAEETHAIFKVRGEGYISISPVPDVIHCFSSMGHTSDPSYKATYQAVMAHGKDSDGDYLFDSSGVTIDISWSESFPEEGSFNRDTFIIVEYRVRGSSLPQELVPVERLSVRSSTFEKLWVPIVPAYVIQNLYGRAYAINDEDYKKIHFRFFDGPADYTKEQLDHYLGIGETAVGQSRGWKDRHEAFTMITQQGLNRMDHDTVADLVNEKTRVMWDWWRWGEGFWWDESIFDAPGNASRLNRPVPGVENCLEFVPHVWDAGFNSGCLNISLARG